jgi:hypothetical protein
MSECSDITRSQPLASINYFHANIRRFLWRSFLLINVSSYKDDAEDGRLYNRRPLRGRESWVTTDILPYSQVVSADDGRLENTGIFVPHPM